jgi:EmrB/QacA subfamily drug resistance transporter
MHPAISYRLTQARTADLREQARRDTLARAARGARREQHKRAAARSPRPAAPPGRRARPRPSPRTVLAIASLGSAVAFIDATIVNIAFPSIARSFPGTPISSLSWVLNSYNVLFAALLMAAAGIADMVGRRRVFVAGLQLFTVGSLLCAIAPSAGTLIAFRMVQALGAAFLVPSALALVLQAFPPARRSHGVALLSAVGAAAAGLGPSLGGLLVTAAGWRLVFLVNVPVGVAAVLLARRQLAESRVPGLRRIPDLPGTLLFAAGIGALVLAVVNGQSWGWDSARVIGCLSLAVACGTAVGWRCRWHRSPVLDLSLLRIRTFSAGNAMMVIGAAGFYGYTLSNVLFLTSVWRYSPLQAGLALTVGPVVAVLVAAPTSRLAQRIGPRPVLFAGCMLWGGAVLWFVERVGTMPDFTGQWLPGMVLLGIGAGTAFPNLAGAAVAAAPGSSFATATGMNSVARQVGAALGVAVAVAIIGVPTPANAFAVFHGAWTFGAICLFAAGLGCLLVGRAKPAEAPAPAAAPGGTAPGDAGRAVPARTGLPPASRAPRPRHMTALGADDTATPGPESAATFLARTPLFAAVDPELIEQVAARSRTRRLTAGKWLFREHDTGDEMYVVRAGRLEVVDEGADAVIREYRRGDALGEVALLTGSPRSASARAVRDSEVIAVDKDDFAGLLGSSPALSSALNRSLSRRLQDTRASAPTARSRPGTVALIALDDRIPLRWLAIRLAGALRAHLSVAVLDGADAPGAAAPGEPAAVYGPILDRAEAACELVLLTSGSGLNDPWTRFCLQQADRILVVTAGGPVPPTVGEYPELQACDLVAYGARPGALAGWAAALDPAGSHVIREAELDADISRVARRLSGTSVGIVLSGGGARAFSHIGVLDELTAAGVTIDRVAGVSMGAMIGALFAMGHDADEMDSICFEEWVQRRPLRDFTFPRHSLIRGERFQSMLHRTFGAHLIEELPRGFMCGSTELRSGRLEIARYGPLWEAVGFSINLPVIAPPQVRGRKIFIDGSLVDNLPVKAMADTAEGPIIAVDVKAVPRRKVSSLTGAHARNARPPRAAGTAGAPGLGETVTRLLLLGSENTTVAARQHADLVIRPRAEGVGLLEFDQLDAARAAGRAAAREALKRAPAGLVA